jgi:hypothetical protein
VGSDRQAEEPVRAARPARGDGEARPVTYARSPE